MHIVFWQFCGSIDQATSVGTYLEEKSTVLSTRANYWKKTESLPSSWTLSSRLYPKPLRRTSNIVTRQFRAWKTRLTRTCLTTRLRHVSLHHNFQGVRYEAEKMQRAKWQTYACVKGPGWNKHKFLYMVYNGSLQSQGVVVTSRCLWHERFDRYGSDFYRIHMDKWRVLWIKLVRWDQLYHAGFL